MTRQNGFHSCSGRLQLTFHLQVKFMCILVPHPHVLGYPNLHLQIRCNLQKEKEKCITLHSQHQIHLKSDKIKKQLAYKMHHRESVIN